MIEQKISEMNKWFEEKIAACEQRGRELTADERKDEAVFEKVRANIYDVFRTWLNVAVKIGNGDEKAIRTFFADRSEQLPAGWTAAYDKAREHNDAARMQTEQVKLDTFHQIREKFDKVWEGAE